MKTMNSIIMKLSALALTLMLAFNNAQAQMPTDSIVADFNEFVRLLEETHPDPYTNYGGRPFFRRAAMETRFSLILDSVTSTDELSRRIRQFLIPLHDGHTGIEGSFGFDSNEHDNICAPVSFSPISDGVIIVSISSEYKDLLGSRLIAIEGIPFKKVCEDLAQNFTAENEIGRITHFCFVSSLGFGALKKVLPDMRQDSITYQILTPDGKPMDLTLPIIQAFGGGDKHLASVEEAQPLPPQKNLSYMFVDDKKNTMYFRSSQIMARDALEYIRSNGMGLDQYLSRVYYSFNDDEMPQDVDEALARIPSFSDEFDKMLQQMKKNKSKNLIIDLRGNGGGYTPIVIPTLYQMWGDKFIMDHTNFDIKFYQLLSPLYMKKMNVSMEQADAMLSSQAMLMGDYMLNGDAPAPEEITDEYRNMFIGQMMSSVKDKLMAQQGKPVYTPEHVYVLVNDNTYSAAFHYMFYLWKMGATVVGLPSKQAPNTYMEVTPFELPRTGLKGSISNSLQMFLPVDDPRANQFTPDLMPTYEDYKRYNFNRATELLYLLDYIKGKK